MKRPEITKEVIVAGVRSMGGGCSWNDEQVEDIANQYTAWGDGYSLAKSLDMQCGWDISSGDVDDLDGVDCAVKEAHRKVCAQWVIDNNIQPPLPIGTMTTIGEITGVVEYEPATYYVKETGCTNENRRRFVKFEDAKAVTP